MANKFISIPKVFSMTFFLFFLFYAVLAAPYWFELFKYQSVSGSGIGYALLGRQVDMESNVEATVIKPVSRKFGLVIPVLGLNKVVHQDVDLADAERLGVLLKDDLVHLKGSVLPNRLGTLVIFGHSTTDLINTRYYNPDFYLLNKLVEGNLIYVVYQEVDYLYKVTSVSSQAPDYFDFFSPARERKLVLVSGWPPGTSLRLRVVEAAAVIE
ncbi:sortase [Patescibacteria group bacterium]|nr:sortase [Patescibacteria group bacterium]